MIRIRPSMLLSGLLLVGPGAALDTRAQALEVPQLSVRAKVEQRVGVTDFAVEYNSPAVRGRKIWGDLVPFDQLWRTGANSSTKLTAS
jgi:hypothetical protein